MARLCSSLLLLVAIGLAGCGGGAPKEPRASLPPMKPICVMRGVAPPPVKYALVKPLKLGKQTYGDVRELTIEMVGEARKAYADAIFNYNGGQHFGFWPWRFIRPIVSGDAVQIDNLAAFDCVKLGGEFYSDIAYYGHGELAPVPGPSAESEYERGRREERERIERERGTEQPR